jgi:hypothetical protein
MQMSRLYRRTGIGLVYGSVLATVLFADQTANRSGMRIIDRGLRKIERQPCAE